MLHVDLENAFNLTNRVSFLHAVRHHIPELFSWIKFCYANTFSFWTGEFHVKSAVGTQQDVPLRSLLFALELHIPLTEFSTVIEDGTDTQDCECPLAVFYMDDGVIIGDPPVLQNAI